MKPTLETLFNPAQRQRLSAAIFKRASCRHYTGAPSMTDWAALSYAAGRYELPGARLVLLKVEESFFTGTLLGMGRISGCTTAAVVIASSANPLGRIHAGILGEAFVLEAIHLGLGACWVSGSYRKRMLELPLQDGEAVQCVIAFGIPALGSFNAAFRRRKPIEKLCQGDLRTWPEELHHVASAVQTAPSAMNAQPWQLALQYDRFIITGTDRALTDLGIALCHAELALTTPHTWHFQLERGEPSAWAQANAPV